MALRQSPSGPLAILPSFVREQPKIFEPSYAPTALSPLSTALVLQGAGHLPGQYLVSLSPVVRVAGFTTITATLSWNAPGAGAQSVSLGAGFSPTALGSVLLGTVSLESDGSSPLVLVCSASLPIFGTPVIDLYASAVRVGLG